MRRQLIAWQEELDWQIYEAFGLVEGAEASGPAAVSLPEGEAMDSVAEFGLELGERAFEIVLARRMAAGEVQTTWFERHGSTPITELPRHWPAAYRELVERRIRRIADDPNIRLIEQPEYKRRWNTEPWDEQFTKAARDWLLARLEGYFHEGQRVCELKDGSFNPAAAGFAPATRPALTTTNQLAGTAQTDPAFSPWPSSSWEAPASPCPSSSANWSKAPPSPSFPRSATRKRPAQAARLGTRLGTPAPRRRHRRRRKGGRTRPLRRRARPPQSRRYRPQEGRAGRHPRPAEIRQQRLQEDRLVEPPRQTRRAQGALDFLPRRRAGRRSSPLIAWAGWDHLQQAQALAEYYLDAKSNHGWPATKLKPLLAGLLDLLPWLKQWHNEMDPDYGMGLGDYFEGFLDQECRSLEPDRRRGERCTPRRFRTQLNPL